MNDTHTDPRVQAALQRLYDELCSYERSTGLQSVLIFREQGGFVSRRINGKPALDELEDKTLLGMVQFSR